MSPSCAREGGQGTQHWPFACMRAPAHLGREIGGMLCAAGAAKVFREVASRAQLRRLLSLLRRRRFMLGLRVGYREARADCQCGELIDRIAARAPVRKLLFVEALGHTRVPFAGYRPDHRAGVELATIDAHRATEAAADLERRLDDGVAREARQNRFEIGDFPGRAAAD